MTHPLYNKDCYFHLENLVNTEIKCYVKIFYFVPIVAIYYIISYYVLLYRGYIAYHIMFHYFTKIDHSGYISYHIMLWYIILQKLTTAEKKSLNIPISIEVIKQIVGSDIFINVINYISKDLITPILFKLFLGIHKETFPNYFMKWT